MHPFGNPNDSGLTWHEQPLIHTRLEITLAQDVVVLQRFADLDSELPQTGHTYSVDLITGLALHLGHLTGWSMTRFISSAMQTSPSVRYQLKNYLVVTRNTQRKYIFCCNPSRKHSPHLLTRKYVRDSPRGDKPPMKAPCPKDTLPQGKNSCKILMRLSAKSLNACSSGMIRRFY